MSLQSFPIRSTETIEVPINNVSASQFKFTDNETTLGNVRLTGISISTEAVGKTFSGRTVVPNAITKKAFLTLADPVNNQMIKRLPMEIILTDQKFFVELDRLPVDIRKSFIELQDSTGLTNSMAWLVTIFYEKPE